MQPEINYTMVGQRIRTARLQKKLSQAELGSLVGCSNNHISHIETAQTKVSLSMLSKLALALDQDLDYFLLDTINEQIQNIAQKKDTLCRRMYN